MTPDFTAPELQQLLGRPVRAEVGPEERAALAGRRVLITGAAGSIGSELARVIAASAPAVIGLIDQSELGLFTIERELRAASPDLRVEPYLVDVTLPAAVRRACAEVRPDVVYHAAAYKHVTMAERTPVMAARVNVIGSAVVAEAARAAGARFVLISSDKAADPKSVMGATKRLAEIVTLSLASPAFRPVVVRFGNVLGSSGSVIQIMRECVRAGRPVPITDPDATRYFMTAGEAVALVLRADVFGQAAEIFWLDMGQPVRLGDLATRLVALEQAAGFPATPIEIIGLRPGEKRNETLSDPGLAFQRTIHRRIFVARQARTSHAGVATLIARLRRSVTRADDHAALAVLAASIAGFQPSEQALDAGRRAIAARTGAARPGTRRGKHAA